MSYFMQQQNSKCKSDSVSNKNNSKLSKTILNRRYTKLQELKANSDFFTLQSIKFRHPELYQVYIQIENEEPSKQPYSLTTIFEKALLNSQYKQILNQIRVNYQRQQDEDDNLSEDSIHEEESTFNKEMLLTLVQRLFLQGKQINIDYEFIDKDNNLDYNKLNEEDQQEQYFQTVEEQEIPSTDTGIQDF